MTHSRHSSTGADLSPSLAAYAAKMRALLQSGVDLEVDARFVDMIARRNSTILDVGCGIGNAVNALRARGHQAYGVDPSGGVLDVAMELRDPAWFRQLSATEVDESRLRDAGLPHQYDVVLLTGNVAAFLSPRDLSRLVKQIAGMLTGGGVLVVGTTSDAQGGPVDLDEALASTDLGVVVRYSDWHLGAYLTDSPWCVTVAARDEPRSFPTPDGIFILPSRHDKRENLLS